MTSPMSRRDLRMRCTLIALSILSGIAAAKLMRDPGPPRAHARYEAAPAAPELLDEAPPLDETTRHQAKASRRSEGASADNPLPLPEPPHDPLGAQFADGRIITGETNDKLVLFTFDDGPSLRTTPKLLDTLDELGIRAVFFLSSGRLDPSTERGRKRIALAKDIADRGHFVGDHTVDHALLTTLPDKSVEAQLEVSQGIFKQVFGDRPWLFRPPGGARSPRVDALIAKHGYTQMLWNLGAADHEEQTPEGVLRSFRRGFVRGGVVLLHDTHAWTVDAVPAIVEHLQKTNCELLARGEELYDIVRDPALFFEARAGADPGVPAAPAELAPIVREARQARLRTQLADRCGPSHAVASKDGATGDGATGDDPTKDHPAKHHATKDDGRPSRYAGAKVRAGTKVTEPDRTPDPDAARWLRDASGHSLDGFFSALSRVEGTEPRGGRRVLARVTHIGDSGINRDQLPGHLRERFQARFGDGGAGFVLMEPPTVSYANERASIVVPAGWDLCTIQDRCSARGHYGLGGVAASSRRHSLSRIATRRGAGASWVELWYGAQPGGGTLELTLDDGEPKRIATAAERYEDRWVSLDVEPAQHAVTVRPAGDGPTRAYGVVFETDGPGVVWDTVSLSGAFTNRLLEHDGDHFRRQLRRREPNLVILNLGGNDLRRYLAGTVDVPGFEQETKHLLTRIRQARPDASCLVTGITDHGRSGTMRVRSEHVEPLVEAQERAARAVGCAFFDAYEAMGGAHSARRWHSQGLVAHDLVHLTREGRERMATMLYDALITRYQGWEPER